jgi:hypothetical protein
VGWIRMIRRHYRPPRTATARSRSRHSVASRSWSDATRAARPAALRSCVVASTRLSFASKATISPSTTASERPQVLTRRSSRPRAAGSPDAGDRSGPSPDADDRTRDRVDSSASPAWAVAGTPRNGSRSWRTRPAARLGDDDGSRRFFQHAEFDEREPLEHIAGRRLFSSRGTPRSSAPYTDALGPVREHGSG